MRKLGPNHRGRTIMRRIIDNQRQAAQWSGGKRRIDRAETLAQQITNIIRDNNNCQI
jgi:hypothetical protein